MQNEQTNKTDTQGNESDKVVEEGQEILSEYDKALQLVQRREEASKVELEILAKKEKQAADNLISGTTGGHVETKQVSPEDAIKAGAKEFFKGTQLAEAIDKL